MPKNKNQLLACINESEHLMSTSYNYVQFIKPFPFLQIQKLPCPIPHDEISFSVASSRISATEERQHIFYHFPTRTFNLP